MYRPPKNRSSRKLFDSLRVILCVIAHQAIDTPVKIGRRTENPLDWLLADFGLISHGLIVFDSYTASHFDINLKHVDSTLGFILTVPSQEITRPQHAVDASNRRN